MVETASTSTSNKQYNMPLTFNAVFNITACGEGNFSNETTSYNAPSTVNAKAACLYTHTNSTIKIRYVSSNITYYYCIIGS